MLRRDERDAFTDEDWDDVDDKLVDLPLIEE